MGEARAGLLSFLFHECTACAAVGCMQFANDIRRIPLGKDETRAARTWPRRIDTFRLPRTASPRH